MKLLALITLLTASLFAANNNLLYNDWNDPNAWSLGRLPEWPDDVYINIDCSMPDDANSIIISELRIATSSNARFTIRKPIYAIDFVYFGNNTGLITIQPGGELHTSPIIGSGTSTISCQSILRFNNSTNVDFSDGNNGHSAAPNFNYNLNGKDLVDFADLAILAEHWLSY